MSGIRITNTIPVSGQIQGHNIEFVTALQHGDNTTVIVFTDLANIPQAQIISLGKGNTIFQIGDPAIISYQTSATDGRIEMDTPIGVDEFCYVTYTLTT